MEHFVSPVKLYLLFPIPRAHRIQLFYVGNLPKFSNLLLSLYSGDDDRTSS